jgi:hypothetical protein
MNGKEFVRFLDHATNWTNHLESVIIAGIWTQIEVAIR